jgi:hypothetical protein
MIRLEETLLSQASWNLEIIRRLLESQVHRAMDDDEQREFGEAWGAFNCLIELALVRNSGLSMEAAEDLRRFETECGRIVSSAFDKKEQSVRWPWLEAFKRNLKDD